MWSTLEYVLNGGNGGAANDLVGAFYAGYPVERLRLLLESDDEHVLKTGVWIASELGSRATPVLDDVAPLLNHPSDYVRYYALEVVSINATAAHDRVLARAIRCVQDPNAEVRGQALRCLSWLTDEQIDGCMVTIHDPAIRTLLAWLLHLKATESRAQEIVQRLDDADPLARRFAAVAARRLGPYDPVPLQRAASSPEPDVRRFAERELDILKPRLA
ncbi:MAG: HEAT repeat domain-containing protein [Chloroflexota bacterium]|nr:HEAT repeat domain-containing protein [Chloroflexota bacterium]